MHTIVCCLPKQQSSTIEQYLFRKGVSDYNIVYSQEALEGAFDELEGTSSTLYIFDFINEAKLFEVWKKNSVSIKYLQVITNTSEVADRFKGVTKALYIVQPMMDLISLFWDNKLFEYENVLKATHAGVNLINVNELQVEGVNISALNLIISEQKNAKAKVNYLKIGGKIDGKSIYKSRKSIPEILLEKALKFFKKMIKHFTVSEEFSESVNNKPNDTVDLNEESTKNSALSAFLSNAKAQPIGLIELRVKQLTEKLDESYPSSITGLLLKRNIINKAQKRALDAMRGNQQFVTSLGEMNFLLDKRIISEKQYIDTIYEFFKFTCFTQQEVLLHQADYTELSLDASKEFCCYVLKTFNKDVYTVVIDYDNDAAKGRLLTIFNNVHFLYARQSDITLKLKTEQETLV